MMSDDVGKSYQKEWKSLFYSIFYFENLRSSAVKGKLRNSHFRSICWKIFLECLPEDPCTWIDTTKQQRKNYDEILDKFHINPRKDEKTMDISLNNPLSQSVQSPWNQYFQDSELKVTIEQDVVRTFPEVEFFHSKKIQEMMTNILFFYAREYPHISYKQGMHELLAPIIFVLHYDQQSYLEASKSDNLELDIHIILNQNYIEHDAFYLFCNLMEAVEPWYTMTESPYSKCTIVSAEPFTEDVLSPVNSLGLKLRNIYKNLLKYHDNELFLFLEQMEITPQIFGIRWLRLLFGREFPIHDLLIIWDAIFAEGISFDLVDYIFVAMLIAIRELLLKSDYTSCLRHLMHYPNITDVQYIIDLALHLRDPGRAKPDVVVQSYIQSQPKFMKENKSLKNSFPKTVFSSQLKSSSSVKTIESRPKSLKISSVVVPVKNKDIVDENEGFEESAEVFAVSNTINYNTFPRTSIRNVMESKTIKFKSLDVSQSFGNIEDKDFDCKTASCREMVPLVPSSQALSPESLLKKHKKSPLKSKNEDVRALNAAVSEMKIMNEYCADQLTQHISQLQECLIGQSLLYEDEMFIALAGLKRARDILKGTVPFSEEVVSDDQVHNYISASRRESGDLYNEFNNKHLNSENSDDKKSPQKKSPNDLKHHASENSQNSTFDCVEILDALLDLNHDSDNFPSNKLALQLSDLQKNS